MLCVTPNVPRFVDYLKGITLFTKPKHTCYGQLPLTEARDPTCFELRDAVEQRCQSNSNTPQKDETLAMFCGMGTTWNPTYQQCVLIPDELLAIDRTMQTNLNPVYPSITEIRYKSCKDKPSTSHRPILGTPQDIPRTFPSVKTCTNCSADATSCRYRYPLTSKKGQEQAKLYVTLFRKIYEYQGHDEIKEILRYKIRQLIDNHLTFSKSGIHLNGVFLPWHRWYLLEMETILMQGQEEYALAKNCSTTFVGIPYFDWHNLKNKVSLHDFINSETFHDSLGQKKAPHRCVGVNKGAVKDGGLAGFLRTNGKSLTRCWNPSFSFKKSPKDKLHHRFTEPCHYDKFRHELEVKFHNKVHSNIGGSMGQYYSSNDPIFFTHHANVDKIWADWQKRSDSHRDAFSTTLGCSFRHQTMPASTATPEEMLDSKKQKNCYNTDRDCKTFDSVEYVDLDTKLEGGKGNTLSSE